MDTDLPYFTLGQLITPDDLNRLVDAILDLRARVEALEGLPDDDR